MKPDSRPDPEPLEGIQKKKEGEKMRDIKFRGKRFDNGEFVVGDLTRYSEEMSYITVDLIEGEVYRVASKTVGQYTGLKDKKGVEIYEGDIVKHCNFGTKLITWGSYDCLKGNLGFMYYMTIAFLHENDSENVEIIGNIYNNPELLEVHSNTQSVAQEEPEITVKDVLMYEAAQREQGFGPEDEEPIPYQVVGKYEALGKSIGALVDRKNKQYGDAFNRGGSILEVLYPDGVRPEQYRDMLGVIRVVDKLFRVANGKQGQEDPWQDIAGYGLLGTGE